VATEDRRLVNPGFEVVERLRVSEAGAETGAAGDVGDLESPWNEEKGKTA
jgi:hypothetical protein